MCVRCLKEGGNMFLPASAKRLKKPTPSVEITPPSAPLASSVYPPPYGKIMLVICVLTFCISAARAGAGEDLLQAKLKASEAIIASSLESLHARWQIDTYPNFLRSVSMSHTAWEVMKVKYESKILDAHSSANSTSTPFVISFMGSSVTAGHDSPFNTSFPVQTGLLIAPALVALGITVESRNAAMGNNPCLPYDVCPRTFAGPDADVVHWEQSFNCFGSDNNARVIFEQFLRQSMGLPHRPVVVFTSSDTPNWKPDACSNINPATARPIVSAEDRRALDHLKRGQALLIASESNKQGPAMKGWTAMTELFRSYQVVTGIQLWDHTSYQDYKCLGPYIKEWQNPGVASWHPSALGHELRAAHYAYFWLLILKDAVIELQKNLTTSSFAAVYAAVKKHERRETGHVPAKPIYASDFSDNMQCLTTFEPRHDPLARLTDYVIPSGDDRPPFKSSIFEELTEPRIINKARERGYKDFKHMLFGDKDSSPLSVRIRVQASGTAFLCQPPGNWGKLPSGFKNFWEAGTKVYLTRNLPDGKDAAGKSFKFEASAAEELHYTNRRPKDTQTVRTCRCAIRRVCCCEAPRCPPKLVPEFNPPPHLPTPPAGLRGLRAVQVPPRRARANNRAHGLGEDHDLEPPSPLEN